MTLSADEAVALALDKESGEPASGGGPAEGGVAGGSGAGEGGSPNGAGTDEGRRANETGTDEGHHANETLIAVTPPSTLTPREREIAALIVRGLTNRAIAGELFISTATAARHVANIMAKLGFQSRTQIAAWMADNDSG